MVLSHSRVLQSAAEIFYNLFVGGRAHIRESFFLFPKNRVKATKSRLPAGGKSMERGVETPKGHLRTHIHISIHPVGWFSSHRQRRATQRAQPVTAQAAEPLSCIPEVRRFARLQNDWMAPQKFNPRSLDIISLFNQLVKQPFSNRAQTSSWGVGA